MAKNDFFRVKEASNRKMSSTKVAQHPRKCGYGSHQIQDETYAWTDKCIFPKTHPKPNGSPDSKALSLPQVLELHVLLLREKMSSFRR